MHSKVGAKYTAYKNNYTEAELSGLSKGNWNENKDANGYSNIRFFKYPIVNLILEYLFK